MTATEIFEKHWTKSTGKPLDETTKAHMKYFLDAMEEYAKECVLRELQPYRDCFDASYYIDTRIDEIKKEGKL